MNNRDEGSQPFKLVLVARPSSIPPSELEVLLRNHCHKLTVHPQLNRAHIVIPFSPDGGKTARSKSLSIRFYSYHDLKRLDSGASIRGSKENPEEELKGLQLFSRTFQLSLIFFQVPPSTDNSHPGMNGMNEQDPQRLPSDYLLDDSDSFTRRAMNLVTSELPKDSSFACRMMLVPDAETALTGIQHFVRCFDPAKLDLKKQYFQQKHIENCLPVRDSTMKDANSSERDARRTSHIRRVISEWAHHFRLPEGEENVLFELMGNLQSIATLGAMGARNLPSTIPLESRTVSLLRGFFDCPPQQHQNNGASQAFEGSLDFEEIGGDEAWNDSRSQLGSYQAGMPGQNARPVIDPMYGSDDTTAYAPRPSVHQQPQQRRQQQQEPAHGHVRHVPARPNENNAARNIINNPYRNGGSQTEATNMNYDYAGNIQPPAGSGQGTMPGESVSSACPAPRYVQTLSQQQQAYSQQQHYYQQQQIQPSMQTGYAQPQQQQQQQQQQQRVYRPTQMDGAIQGPARPSAGSWM